MRRPAISFGHSRFAQLTVVTVLMFAAIYGTLLLQNNHGTKAATALCYGQPGTHTAVAPASVNPGQTFKITNITGSANTNIATVNSTQLSLGILNATPSTVTESWTGGPVHGDYTSSYPDITLTATGTSGSQISVSITGITAQVTIAGVNSTITCSTSNNQLTANSPGQSLNLATINIVAPAAAAAPTTTKSKSVSTSPVNTAQPKTNQNTDASPPRTTTNDQIQTQTINVTTRDYNGHPVQGAKVVLDSMPAINTDKDGLSSFKDISPGKHNLSITAQGQTVTKALQLDPNNNGEVLGIQVQLHAPSHKIRNLTFGAGLGFVAAIIGCIYLIRWLKQRKPVIPLAAPAIPTSAASSSIDPFESKIIKPTNDGSKPSDPPK